MITSCAFLLCNDTMQLTSLEIEPVYFLTLLLQLGSITPPACTGRNKRRYGGGS